MALKVYESERSPLFSLVPARISLWKRLNSLNTKVVTTPQGTLQTKTVKTVLVGLFQIDR